MYITCLQDSFDEEPLVRKHAQWAIDRLHALVDWHPTPPIKHTFLQPCLARRKHKQSSSPPITKKVKNCKTCSNTGIELVTPAQSALIWMSPKIHTYAENAAKKAVAFARASSLVSLADDSGLEVDALDGAPGLYSARYGYPNGGKLSDAERRAFLIKNLQDKPRPWTARFHATIAVAVPNSETHLAEGFCEGEIISEERGTGGFGYDPIFLLSELGKTMAELSMEEKNRLSHRARAVINAKEVLKTLFKNVSRG
jgi:XTP/dITP diphosphohydrolase